jgi:hypothetical protein
MDDGGDGRTVARYGKLLRNTTEYSTENYIIPLTAICSFYFHEKTNEADIHRRNTTTIP